MWGKTNSLSSLPFFPVSHTFFFYFARGYFIFAAKN